MPILSYRGQTTHKIAVGQSNSSAQKYYNTYLNKIAFYDFNQGLYSTGSRSKNAYYDSMQTNCIFKQGYVPFCGGDRYDGKIGDLFGSIGSLYIPIEFRSHTYDRSTVTDLSYRMKIPITIAHYGSDKNGSIRYLPNKNNPQIIDLYPHTLLQTIQSGKELGGVNKVIKKDIIKIASNQLANYLANKEQYFLDENDNLRSMEAYKQYKATGKLNLGQIYYPPELDDNMGWGYHIFTPEFRRECANFGYYSMNRLETIYEDNPNASSNYLNAYLKLHNLQDKNIERNYYNIELEEKTYSAENLFKEIFTKIFGNFDEENLTFVYKDKTYKIDENTKTIYDENNEEVLFIQLDDGTYFSTNYDKVIVQAVKNEINPYIDNFIDFLKNKPYIASVKGNDFYQWYIKRTEHQSDGGDHASGNTYYTYEELQRYSNYLLFEYNVLYKQNESSANYLKYQNIHNQINGIWLSANRIDIDKLISINDKYSFSNMNISKSEDELSNSSYENSMTTPILMVNYIDYGIKGDNGYALWGKYPLVNPLDYTNNQYCPVSSQLKYFYGGELLGYNHSNTTEDYIYFKNTTVLQSVLDNYVGYEGEGQNIVFQYDNDGNIVYDNDGLPVIDEEKTIYPEKVDENCSLPLTERIFKVLNKYPYFIDLENISIEESPAYTKTITFNELSRKKIDSNLKDNMGNTLQNYEIEVEAMFQVKEIQYNIDLLPYYKVVTSNGTTQQSIDYIRNFKFSPLFYVYGIDNFNMHLWKTIPETKKLKLIFMKDIIDELEKIGNDYIEVKYSYDDENGNKIDSTINIDGDIQTIKSNFSGNKKSYQMIKYCPQVLLAVGSDKVTTKERNTYLYQGGLALQICATTALVMLSSIIASKLAVAFWTAGIAIFLASRRNVTGHTIGFKHKTEGDFFYNIGNRWEWVYHKNNGKRPDLWDKFENPSYSMEVLNPLMEKTVKRNPPVSRIFGDRNFKSKKTKYDPYVNNYIPVGLEYQERPFVMSSFDNNELKNLIGKNSKFKGDRTTKENQAYTNRTNFTDSYQRYFESDSPNNITHIYYGQKMCLTWLLNGNLRRVKSLLQSAYIYLDYLCSIKGIIKGEKYVSVIIPHRMQFQSFKKNIRIGKYPLDEDDLYILGDNLYKCQVIGDKYYILNKKTNDKVMIDFKTYIPDYKSQYSTNNNIENVRKTLLQEIKNIYNGEENKYSYWFKNNVNEITHNGDYNEIPKLEDNELGHMESFIEEYLSNYNDEELLQIYNEDNNTNYKNVINTNYSSENTLDIKGELNQFIDNSIEENSIQTIKNFVLSKIKTNKISTSLGYEKQKIFSGGKENDSYNMITYMTFRSNAVQSKITYDIRTLCLGYQIALEKIMQGKSEIEDENFNSKFYTFLDSKEENTISKKTIVNHIKNKMKDIIPTNIIITLEEMRNILSVTNKYTNLFDMSYLNNNSIAYNLWIGYYICPNEFKDKILELQNEIVSWKVLLEKNAVITRDVDKKDNSISSMLPMYQEVWKKIPYNSKLFYSQFSFTYDLYYEQMVPKRMGGYEATLIRTFLIWKSIFLMYLAVVLAIALAVIAIVSAPFTGGTSLALLACVAAILMCVSALLFTVAFVLQAIGVYSSNPSTQQKYSNLSKSFSKAGQYVGYVAMALNIYAGIQQAIQLTGIEMTKAIIQESAKALTTIAGIVVSATDNESVQNTWTYIGIGSAITGMGMDMKWNENNNNPKISYSPTIQNSMKLVTEINNLINRILTDVYSKNINNLKKDIAELENLYEKYEKELEEEEIELRTNKFNPMAVFNSNRPLNLTQYEDMPNLTLLNSLNLPSIETDEIIDVTFEILNN